MGQTLSVQITAPATVPLLAEPLQTVADYLAAFPDEENRPVDVVAGQPVMSPSPTGLHQMCVSELFGVLRAACPAGPIVMTAPWDWVRWDHPLQIRQPDIVVVTREQARAARLTSPPLLAVEVLSPTTVERDAVAKREEYARAGLEHYWIVDHETPRIHVLRADTGQLRFIQQVTGDQRLDLTEPFPVSVTPSQLAD